jgi:hypothetical protein
MIFQSILICFLIYVLIRQNRREGFQSDEILNKKANILYKNKNLFTPQNTYSNIKKQITWIDPVIYNDVFSLSQKEKMSVSDIKNALNMY